MKKFSLLSCLLVAVAALALSALPGCSTNTQGDSASPVFLFGNFQLLPLDANVSSNAAIQFDTTILTSRLKNPSATSLQFLDVQIEKYTVVWSRLDGGKTASPQQDFPGNVIVPPNGSATLTSYPY